MTPTPVCAFCEAPVLCWQWCSPGAVPIRQRSPPCQEVSARPCSELVLVHAGEIRFLCSPGPGTNWSRSRGECDGKVEAASPPLPAAHLATQSPPASCSSGDMSPEATAKGELPSSTQVRSWGERQRCRLNPITPSQECFERPCHRITES